MQLDLFGNSVEQIETLHSLESLLISWSYSKMQCFRECPRKYYFNYYGSKKTRALREILKKELIELSKLSNKHMVQGSFIHQLISIYFKKAKKDEEWDYNRITNFANKLVCEAIQYSLAIAKDEHIENPKYPKPIFKEIFYNKVESEVIKKELLDKINACLKNFFVAPAYEHLRQGGRNENSKIEDEASFSLGATLEVSGKMDIAFQKESHLIIADWKTGKKSIEDTSLQLLVYALWAKQLNEKPFHDIEIQKAYLLDGTLEKLEFSDLHVNRAQARIMQDAELLREMDEYGKNADRNAFAMHIGKNCEHCPYEQICHSKN